MQSEQRVAECAPVDPWVSQLRAQLVDAGYDGSRVDQVLAETLDRFEHARVRQYVPLLVERAVQRALRDDC